MSREKVVNIVGMSLIGAMVVLSLISLCCFFLSCSPTDKAEAGASKMYDVEVQRIGLIGSPCIVRIGEEYFLVGEEFAVRLDPPRGVE